MTKNSTEYGHFKQVKSDEIHEHSQKFAEKWSNKKVQLPKLPFATITVIQTVVPVFPIVFLWAVTYSILDKYQVDILIRILLLPAFIILSLLLYIWGITFICWLMNFYFEKRSPQQEGVYSREFKDGNVADPAVHYYHMRGFMYKWPVWASKKSPFPWSVNFVLKHMAGNKIHRNAMYGDGFPGLEMTEMASNSVVMEGSAISSHVVDSIYGDLTIKHVKLEENAVIMPNTVMTPGGIIRKDTVVGPKSMITKDMIVDGTEYRMLYGAPCKNIGYTSFIELLPQYFRKDWEKKCNQRDFSR